MRHGLRHQLVADGAAVHTVIQPDDGGTFFLSLSAHLCGWFRISIRYSSSSLGLSKVGRLMCSAVGCCCRLASIDSSWLLKNFPAMIQDTTDVQISSCYELCKPKGRSVAQIDSVPKVTLWQLHCYIQHHDHHCISRIKYESRGTLSAIYINRCQCNHTPPVIVWQWIPGHRRQGLVFMSWKPVLCTLWFSGWVHNQHLQAKQKGLMQTDITAPSKRASC